jgi:predicted N-acetyltransferase YhbS
MERGRNLNISIRPERPTDIDALDELIRAAFRDQAYSGHTEQQILRALRAAGQLTVSLVAEGPGEEGAGLLGQVALSPVSISDNSPHWYGLGPLAVRPGWQRQGIGTELMQQALAELQALGAAGCVLLGEPGFYRRFGFEPRPGLLLPGVPAEYFMALAFGAAVPRGIVSYCDAFTVT